MKGVKSNYFIAITNVLKPLCNKTYCMSSKEGRFGRNISYLTFLLIFFFFMVLGWTEVFSINK